MRPASSTANDSLFTSAYSILRRSGALETAPGRRLFTLAYFLYKRYLEDDLQDLVRAYPALLQGGNVMDIGANIGYTAALLARAADPGRKVYAFEPDTFNHDILRRVASRPKHRDKIVAVHSAVGAADGTIELWLNDHHHADHRIITDRFRSLDLGMRGVTVPMVSIDQFVEKNPGPVSFVKIDVQGYELPVCQGMKDTLENNPGITLVLEYMPSIMRELGFNPAELIEFLVSRGFEIYLAGPHGKVSRGAVPEIEGAGYVDLLFRRHPIPAGGEA